MVNLGIVFIVISIIAFGECMYKMHQKGWKKEDAFSGDTNKLILFGSVFSLILGISLL